MFDSSRSGIVTSHLPDFQETYRGCLIYCNWTEMGHRQIHDPSNEHKYKHEEEQVKVYNIRITRKNEFTSCFVCCCFCFFICHLTYTLYLYFSLNSLSTPLPVSCSEEPVGGSSHTSLDDVDSLGHAPPSPTEQ